MSYRSGQYSQYPQHHSHDHGRQGPRRPSPSRPPHAPSPKAESGYTLVHAGKQVRFGPVAFWIVVGTVTLLGLWSAATATYFAFRDDVLTRLIARQADMQYAYEDRIAELRAKVDRTTSRQLLDQEQFDQKLEQITRREAALEARSSALGAIADITGSIKPSARSAANLRAWAALPSRSWARSTITWLSGSRIAVANPRVAAQSQQPSRVSRGRPADRASADTASSRARP